MSRTPFDQLSKQLLEELLPPHGQVETSREVPGETHFIDLFFSPNPTTTADPSTLGLLGRLTSRACLIEPYRNAPDAEETDSCLLKLTWVTADMRRRARRDQSPLKPDHWPLLWILTPTASESYLRSLGAQPQTDWPPGVYFAPTAFRTRVIAIHQLPETPDTLLLRLLGKGRKQQRALEEFYALPESDPIRLLLERILADWKVTIEAKRLDEQELAMPLSQAFLDWEQRVQQQARLEGIRGVARNMLQKGFSIDQIAEATGLSIEQIQSLRSEQN